MVFQYIPRMDIVCVKGEPHSRFLRVVLEGDTGEDSPNPANEYQIDAFDKCVACYHGTFNVLGGHLAFTVSPLDERHARR
jgi:hypothetical protein